jgi:hypothetical protein
MRTSTNRVNKHREALRKAGLRPIQIWVPDTKRKEFIAECRRQSLLAAKHDKTNADLMRFMNDAVSDVPGWEA